MTVMIALAVLCAATLAVALHPLMKHNPRQGWRVMALCLAAALGLYVAIGSPDLASAPAAFETGDRHDRRLDSQRELVLMEALTGEPDNVKLLYELGVLRVQSDRPEDALPPLLHARSLAPKNPDVAEAIGAAHYKLALFYKLQPRAEAQRKFREHLEAARKVTPKGTDLSKEIQKLLPPSRGGKAGMGGGAD